MLGNRSKSVDRVQVWLRSDETKTLYMETYVQFMKAYCVRDKYVKYSWSNSGPLSP
jgi:hypothetical protein